MNYEDKKTLITTLGAMLPYCVMMSIPLSDGREGISRLTGIDEDGNCTLDIPTDMPVFKVGENTKPYLRSLSSFTNEEKKEIANSIKNNTVLPNLNKPDINEFLLFTMKSSINVYNWLIENKFDCFNLIEKGLAIEAKDGMYNSITKMIKK